MFILTSPYQQQPFGKRTMRVVIILMTAYLTVIITSKMMKLISTVDKFNYFKDFWLSANVLKRYDLYDMFFFMRRYNGHWLLVLLHFLPKNKIKAFFTISLKPIKNDYFFFYFWTIINKLCIVRRYHTCKFA